ncbi:GNAT family N-acetyltransferase [Nocardioides sp.]|uniref:GNAT family N-acetyltransferase n=1 Tax=Nocardioides sp. TaxID=35761 RepID=UPI003D0FF8F4
MNSDLHLRAVEPRDHAFVIELNRLHVDLTAPMEEPRMLDLLGWSERALVIEVDDTPAGFVFTFAAHTPYDSPSYREFCRRFDAFTYLDRIVIDSAFQRRGLGTAVYDDLEASADTRLVLEVNIDPPNEPSLAFHRARGYVGVGEFGPTDHRVLQMSKELG